MRKTFSLFSILLTITFCSFSQVTSANPPKLKPASCGKLPPAPPPPQRITPGLRYDLFRANQNLQQSFNNIQQTGYNIGATLALISKK